MTTKREGRVHATSTSGGCRGRRHRGGVFRSRHGRRPRSSGDQRLRGPRASGAGRRHVAGQHLSGAACDVPSQLYSFSRALRPGWTRSFSGQAEILQYLRDFVESARLGERLHLGCNVSAAWWDEDTSSWTIETAKGTVVARHLVTATARSANPRCLIYRASASSPGRCSTPPAGTTTTNCQVSASP